MCPVTVTPMPSPGAFRAQLVMRPVADTAEDHGDWVVIQRPAAPLGPRRATPVHTLRLAEGISLRKME